MGGLCRDILTPGRDPSAWPFEHSAERTSVRRIKMCGDRGSPCQSPRDGRTNPCGEPFIKKE